MESERSEFVVTDVVIPNAGREAGRLYYVVGFCGEYLLLANGKDRSLGKPKRKKRKHAEKVLRSETRVAQMLRSGDKVLDSELRRDLAILRQDMQSKAIGG